MGSDSGAPRSAAIRVRVLERVAQLRAEQHQSPTRLHPDKEQRQGRKAPVNGVVVGHPHLKLDVDRLDDLEKNSSDDAAAQGRLERDPGVRHGHVDQGEEGADQNERAQLQGLQAQRAHHARDGEFPGDGIDLGAMKTVATPATISRIGLRIITPR